MATGFHLRADERLNALETALWAGTAAVVAVGRWQLLVAARVAVSPWFLIAALALLLPSAIANVVVLLRRPVSGGAPG
jgi:hypothetical protein